MKCASGSLWDVYVLDTLFLLEKKHQMTDYQTPILPELQRSVGLLAVISPTLLVVPAAVEAPELPNPGVAILHGEGVLCMFT